MRPGVSSLNLATAVAVALYVGGGLLHSERPHRSRASATS
jgi:hypothetical protein